MAKSTFQYSVSGTITDLQGKFLNGLNIRAIDQDFKTEDLLGQATTDENGKYRITYTDQDFRIGGKESGGADIIIRVYDGDTLLKETEPLRNAGRDVTIDVTVEKQVKEEPPQPVLTSEQQARLHNLSEAIFDQKLRASFEASFTETKGDFTATMATLSQKKEFDDFTLKQLTFTHELAELSGDHTPLVTAFRLNDATNSLRDIALGFNRAQLTDFVRTTGVPEGVEGETEGQRLTAYSGQMYTKLFQVEPTAMIQRMVASSGESPIADKMMSGTVATFLSNQPAAFNIKTTSSYEAF